MTSSRYKGPSPLAFGTWRCRFAFIPVTGRIWVAACLSCFWVFLLLIPILLSTEHLAWSLSSVPAVEGTAVIHRQNQADARKRALRTGWRTAVEIAVADLADFDVRVARAHVLQQQVYAQAAQYIQSYRVLWDYPDVTRRMYRVGLEVEVAMERLAQKLVTLGITPPKRDIPRLLVILTTRQPAQQNRVSTDDITRTLVKGLRDSIRSQSLHLIKGDSALLWDRQGRSAIRRANAAQADLVLGGWVDIEGLPGETADRNDTVLAAVDVALWDATTGTRLAHEHTQSLISSANIIRPTRNAVARATEQIATQLEPILHQNHQADAIDSSDHDAFRSQSTDVRM